MRTGCSSLGRCDSGFPFIDLSPMPNRENQDDYIFILDLA